MQARVDSRSRRAAFRPGWAYGFAELAPGQRELIARSKRIANPGCYPTGFISLTRPLVDAGLLPAGTGLICHAVSGYSGGGKALIKARAPRTGSQRAPRRHSATARLDR